jgi:hypothetical protein
LALRTVAPLVPLTVTLNVPSAAVLLAVKVTLLFTLPLAGGVTLAGLGEQVTPLGTPLQARATADEKPPVEVTVQVVVRLWLRGRVRLAGLHATEKSG